MLTFKVLKNSQKKEDKKSLEAPCKMAYKRYFLSTHPCFLFLRERGSEVLYVKCSDSSLEPELVQRILEKSFPECSVIRV